MADPPAKGDELEVVGERPAGRPPKLNAGMRNAILRFLAQSMSRTDACKLVQCTLQTLSNTMKRDPVFKGEVHQAELTGKLGATMCVTLHAQTDPKIAIEFLQRKYPDEWGKRTRVAIESGGAGMDGNAVMKQLLAKLGLGGAVVEPPAAEGAAAPPVATAAGETPP